MCMIIGIEVDWRVTCIVCWSAKPNPRTGPRLISKSSCDYIHRWSHVRGASVLAAKEETNSVAICNLFIARLHNIHKWSHVWCLTLSVLKCSRAFSARRSHLNRHSAYRTTRLTGLADLENVISKSYAFLRGEPCLWEHESAIATPCLVIWAYQASPLGCSQRFIPQDPVSPQDYLAPCGA